MRRGLCLPVAEINAAGAVLQLTQPSTSLGGRNALCLHRRRPRPLSIRTYFIIPPPPSGVSWTSHYSRRTTVRPPTQLATTLLHPFSHGPTHNFPLFSSNLCPHRTAHPPHSACAHPSFPGPSQEPVRCAVKAAKISTHTSPGSPLSSFTVCAASRCNPAQYTSAESREQQHARTLQRLREHACCAAVRP